MSEDNLINQSRLESARKQRASRQRARAASSFSTSRGGVSSSRGTDTRGIATQCDSKSSEDKSASKVLTLAPKSYARNSLSGISPTESGSKNLDSSNSSSPMLLAALIREVENLDVPNGPFYL